MQDAWVMGCLFAPADGLYRAGIDRVLAIAGIALVRTDHGRFLVIIELEHPGADFRAVSAADAELVVY
jgi:hypothetical protein